MKKGENQADPAEEDPSRPRVDLSILIAHRQGTRILLDCLQSIHDFSGDISFEVILVDNASVDDSVEAAQRDFPETHVVRSDDPIGYGAANNLGFSVSTGRYVLVLNDDTLVTEGALSEMVRLLDSEPDIGCLGCRLLNPDGSLQHSVSVDPTLLNQVSSDLIPAGLPGIGLRTRARQMQWPHDTQRDVDVISGAAMMIRRDVYALVGGFDEGFLYFTEEFDLCKRIRNAGFRVVFTPDSEIVHLGGQTMRTVPLEHYLMRQRGRERYFRKHRKVWQIPIVRLSRVFGISMRCLYWLPVWMLSPGQRDRARGKLQTYIRVLPRILFLARYG